MGIKDKLAGNFSSLPPFAAALAAGVNDEIAAAIAPLKSEIAAATAAIAPLKSEIANIKAALVKLTNAAQTTSPDLPPVTPPRDPIEV